jgi:PhnB protein
MASVSTYLNFRNQSEEAFNFYAKVFGTEIQGIMRHGDVPGMDVPDEAKNLVMNAALPILGGHVLMTSDIPDGMGYDVVNGNSIQISLHPDSRAEADRLHAELSEGGEVGQDMQDMFWGDYYGDLTDKFGIRWLINTSAKE